MRQFMRDLAVKSQNNARYAHNKSTEPGNNLRKTLWQQSARLAHNVSRFYYSRMEHYS